MPKPFIDLNDKDVHVRINDHLSLDSHGQMHARVPMGDHTQVDLSDGSIHAVAHVGGRDAGSRLGAGRPAAGGRQEDQTVQPVTYYYDDQENFNWPLAIVFVLIMMLCIVGAFLLAWMLL